MRWFLNLVVATAGLVLITTALIYLFNQRLAVKLMKETGILALAALVVPAVVVDLARDVDPLTAVLLGVSTSGLAYFIRERRGARRAAAPAQRRGAAERTPVLPRSRDDV